MPVPTVVFISGPVMRPNYVRFLVHGYGPFSVRSALLALEDCRDFVPFVGSKLRRGHMYIFLSYRDFAFVLSHNLFS